MASGEKGLTPRQRKQLRFLRNYAAWFLERSEEYGAQGKPLPQLLAEAIGLLPAVRRRIELDQFETEAELWHDIEERITLWHIEEGRRWRPQFRSPPPPFPPG